MSACPECGQRKTKVLLTDQLRNGWTRRRRQCGHCQARWNTYELPQAELDLSGHSAGDLAIVPRGGHAE